MLLNNLEVMMNEIDEKKQENELFFKENDSLENELLISSYKKMVSFFDDITKVIYPLNYVVEITLNYKPILNDFKIEKKPVALILDMADKNVYMQIYKSMYLLYSKDLDYLNKQPDKNNVYMDEYYNGVDVSFFLAVKNDKSCTYNQNELREVVSIFLSNKDFIEEEIMKKVKEFKDEKLSLYEEKMTFYKQNLEDMKAYIK